MDRGRVTVHLLVGASTLELHELAAYFQSFRDERITHEALTDRIYTELSTAAVTVTKVVTCWKTAGMPVKVTRC
ncbi:hypothetical protein [Nocardia farcinica]|uniref:hypothetical protein n=1 Tax=Nocardia farcinica TaxID=37329 RepID=UPI00245559B6|nr:hypothetical protein [Nocardia farcinica]